MSLSQHNKQLLAFLFICIMSSLLFFNFQALSFFALGFVWMWAGNDRRIFKKVGHKKYRYSFLRLYCVLFDSMKNIIEKLEIKSLILKQFFFLLPILIISLFATKLTSVLILLVGAYLHLVINLLVFPLKED